MNSMTQASMLNSPVLASMSRQRVWGAYLAEIRSECVRYLRMPSFMLPLLLFPTVFYLFFGVLMAPTIGHGMNSYLLASYSVFGIMAAGLFGFGVSLAIERGDGLLTLKRALPMPPAAYLLGKMVMAMLATALLVGLMLVLGATAGQVPLSAGLVLGLLLTGVLGVLPFCALGMWIGTLIKGQAAPGVVNLVYLPMAFLSGLWIPLPVLPTFLQKLAPVFPSYHLEQLALNVVGAQSAASWWHLAVLLGYTLLFTGLAVRRLRRNG